MKFIIAILFNFLFGLGLNAQCASPNVMLFENFDGPSPITGAITANIYGGGSWTNAAYTISGPAHGWFNVQNGLVDVDVYDRQINGFCPDSAVQVTLWTRQSFGVTNVTYSVIDDFGAVLATTTLNLTNTFQLITFNFNATTPGLRVVFHCNSMGGNGVDIIVEDLLVTQCSTPTNEDVTYGVCSQTSTIDLLSLFSATMPTGGVWTGPSPLGNGDLGTFDPVTALNGIYTYTLAAGCSPPSTVTIEVMPFVDLGPDTTLCNGANLTLSAGLGYDSYLWSTGAITESINVSTPGTYDVQVEAILGNLIVNGDFEAGSSNFTTSYIPGTGGGWGLLSNPGQYAITTSPSLVHTNFSLCGDHTSGAGNMLVVNGASVPNSNVWCQDVNITPNTDYNFSCWISNALNDPNVANLQFYVNGVAIGSVFSTSPTGCLWQEYNDIWNSGAQTTATVCIVNQNTSGGGNDFCLDDIQFGPICSAVDTLVVTIETPVQLITVTNPTCVGDADGEIHVTNVDAVEYSINGGAWQVDSFFVNLAQGTYSICSQSAIGCFVCEDIDIIDPAPVTISVSNDTTICENGSALLNATATGGTSYLYHWDFTPDLTSSQNVSPLVGTVYSVFAENENGCISAIETIDVSLFSPLTGNISPLVVICPGESVDFTVTVLGGPGQPYTFNWSSGQTFTGAGSHTITVNPAVTTIYDVTIQDGCESTPISFQTTVEVSPLPQPSMLVLNPDQCEPAVFQIVNTTAPFGTFSTYWLVNGTDQYLNQDTITTNSFNAGDYDVQLIVVSAAGCVDSLTLNGLLHVDPIPTAHFAYSPNPVLMFNPEVHFTNLSSNATNYQWTFEEGNPLQSTLTNPTVQFPDGVVGTYEVVLIATSQLGCADTTELNVIVSPEILIYVPNSFTPDDDEHNQNWLVYMDGIDIYDYELLVFNRWGELVWENHDISIGWDGTFNGQNVQTGMYTWIIHTKDLLNDERYTFNGHVNVMR